MIAVTRDVEFLERSVAVNDEDYRSSESLVTYWKALQTTTLCLETVMCSMKKGGTQPYELVVPILRLDDDNLYHFSKGMNKGYGICLILSYN